MSNWFDNFIKNKTSEEIHQMQYIQLHSSDYNMVKFCKKCGCVIFKKIDIDYIDYYVCEQEIVCKQCGYIVNYWSYGHYENYDSMDDEYYQMEKKMERQKKLERIVNEL